MKLEDQCCTLEQAKKLKELGIIQYSLFYHIDNMVKEIGYEGIKLRHSIKGLKKGMPIDGGVVRYFSAYTVSELGLLLPYRLRDNEKSETPHLRIYRGENEWHVEYHQVFSRPFVRSYAYENLSDGMAHVLIHLIENKLITAEEINKTTNRII